jgi:hypothetical protein
MSVANDLEAFAIQTTKLELKIRRMLQVLLTLKKQQPLQARLAIDALRRQYVVNPHVADMFHLAEMDLEYLNLLRTFEKVMDNETR